MSRFLHIADVSVVFLSAYNWDENIVRVLEAGAADYIVKPLSTTELSARNQAALRRRMVAERSEPYVPGGPTINYARH